MAPIDTELPTHLVQNSWYVIVVNSTFIFRLFTVCILLGAAGCTGVETAPPEQITVEERTGQVSQPTQTTTTIQPRSSTPEQTGGVTTDRVSSNTTNGAVNAYELVLDNVSADETETINGTVRSFYQGMPSNETERLETTAEIANESCNLSTINATTFSTAADVQREGYRLYHVSELLSSNYNQNIDTDRLRVVIQGADRVGQYAPIVGSYNEYHEASCNFDRDDPESVEEFYLASAALGTEIMFVQYGATYRASSRLTRVASHTRAYRTVQTRFGDDALALLMSETHWAARNTLSGAPNFIVEQYTENNLTLESEVILAEIQNQSDFIRNESTAWVNQTAYLTNNTLSNASVDDEIENRTQQVLNESTVDEQIENTTDNLENSSVGGSLENTSQANVTQEETLRDLLNESSAAEAVECVSAQDIGYSTLTGIISDGDVQLSELTQLSNDTRQDIEDCLVSE